MEAGAIDDIVCLLDGGRSWDVLVTQEGPRVGEPLQEIVRGGHLWCLSPCGERPRSVGALVHRRWHDGGMYHSYVTVSPRVSYIDSATGAEQIRIISAHAPHSLDSTLDFDECLDEVRNAVLDGRRQRRLCICGLDANAVLGQQETSDDSRIVGKHGVGTRNDRGYAFSTWLHSCSLAASSTMFRKQFDDCWTHWLWATRQLRQIDYLLIDSIARGKVCNVWG